MSAGSHLWMRLRRWWALQCLQLHHTQLEQEIEALEADVRADTDALACLRMERGRVSMRLRYAQTLDGLHRGQHAQGSTHIQRGQGHQP